MTFRWGNNPRRAELKGRECEIVACSSRMGSVLVRFLDSDELVVTSWRAVA